MNYDPYPGYIAFIVTEWEIKSGTITNHYAKWFENKDDAELWAEFECNDEYNYGVKILPYQ